MEDKLAEICRQISCNQLESLSSTHLKEAILLIKEAIQDYNSQGDPSPLANW